MKSLKYLILASLVAFAACDEDSPGTAPGTQTGTVNVAVTAGGAGVAGATVSLGAAGTTPQTTDGSGNVSFANVPAGSYVVTISGLSADVVCGSTTQPVTVAGNQTTSVSFACNIVSTASISGSVTNQDGTARANATVTITRQGGTAQTVTTGANGQFSLTGLRSGSYTVALAATAGCTTAETTQTVTVSAGEARVVNFTCTETPPPPPGADARVAIQSIIGGTPVPGDPYVGCAPIGAIVEEDALRCRLNITVEVDEGDEVASRLELLLGDEQIYAQDFNQGAAAEGMALAVFDVTASVNTARFDGDTGVPDFLNGETNLRARLFTTASPNTPAHTASLNVELTNTDIMAMDVTTTEQMIGGDDLMWRSGDVTIRALPVAYSGDEIFEVRIVLGAEGGTETGGLSGRTVTRTVDADDDFEVTLLESRSITSSRNNSRGSGNIEDEEATITATSITTAGEVGPCVGPGCGGAVAPEFRFDTRGPVISDMFDALRSTQWINENWLFDQDDFADVGVSDAGVGRTGDYFTYRSGTSLDNMMVVESGDDLPAETLDNSEYLLSLTVVDRFGNTNTMFYAGNEDATPPEGDPDEGVREGDLEDAIDDNGGVIPDIYLFGYDEGNPTIELTDGSLQDAEVIADFDMIEAEYSDNLSGFPVEPVRTVVRRRAPGVMGEDTCPYGGDRDDDCDPHGGTGTITFDASAGTFGDDEDDNTDDDLILLTEAYYEVDRMSVTDEAGNESTRLELTLIRDVSFPVVGGVSFDASLTSGGTETFQAGVFDNLDLNTGEFFLAFDDADMSIRQSVDQLGAFGPAEFTQSATASSSITFISTIQEGAGTAVLESSNGIFRISDFAMNASFAESVDFPPASAATLLAGDFDDGDSDEAVTGEDMESDEAALCWDTDSNGCETNESSTQVRFIVTGSGSDGADGPLGNPFNRIVFYVGLDADNDGVIDVDPNGDPMWTTLGNGSQSVTDDGVTRTYTFRINVSGAQLATAAGRTTQGGIADPADNVYVRAVGYNSAGHAFTVPDGATPLTPGPDGDVITIQLERN